LIVPAIKICKQWLPVTSRRIPELRPWTPLGAYVSHASLGYSHPNENFWRRTDSHNELTNMLIGVALLYQKFVSVCLLR